MFWLGFGAENAAGFFAGVASFGVPVFFSLFSLSLSSSSSFFLVAGLGVSSPLRVFWLQDARLPLYGHAGAPWLLMFSFFSFSFCLPGSAAVPPLVLLPSALSLSLSLLSLSCSCMHASPSRQGCVSYPRQGQPPDEIGTLYEFA